MRYLRRATGGGPRRHSWARPGRSGARRARLPFRVGGQDLRHGQRDDGEGPCSRSTSSGTRSRAFTPVAYISVGYYGRWLWGLERLLVHHGVVTDEEIDARTRALSLQPDASMPRREDPELADLLLGAVYAGMSPRSRGRSAAALRRRRPCCCARGGPGGAHSAAGICPRPHRHRRPLPRRVRVPGFERPPGRGGSTVVLLHPLRA